MTIKLAILIDVLEDINSGAERQVYELLKRIDRSRFEPYLYILHQENGPQEIIDLNVSCCGLGLKRIYDLKGIAEGVKFAGFVRREKIDMVLTYHFASDIWGTIFGKMGGAKAIISSRRDIGFWRNNSHIRAYKFINRWVTKIVVVSGAVKRMVVEEEGVAPEKVEVVHNGVDLTRFTGHKVTRSQGRLKLGLGEDEKVIISVGNFNSTTKGQAVLIEAMKIILNADNRGSNADGRGSSTADGRGLKMIFVGDGALLEGHKVTMSQSHTLKDNIIFLGKREDVPEILSAADVCVLPSLSEGLSNALIEYMAAGKPVVATAVGGNVEVIKDGINGLLVPAKDPAALAVAVMKLFDDQVLAERLGHEARLTVERDFDVSTQIRKLTEFLSNEYRASHKQ